MAIKHLSYTTYDDLDEGTVTEALEDFFKTKKFTKVVKTNQPYTSIYLTRNGKNFTGWVVKEENKTKQPIACFTFLHFDFDFKVATFEPHVFVHRDYRNKGIASSLYRWFLASGHGIATDYHTTGAQKLWDSLARDFKQLWYDPMKPRVYEQYPKYLKSSDRGNLYRVLLGR